MKNLSLYFLLFALVASPALCEDTCTYWCRIPDTSDYTCCDHGNPYTDEPYTVENEAGADEPQVEVEYDQPLATQAPSNCYYYCAYAGEVYCCGDTSQPIPASHDAHDGKCPEEDEHVCKSTGVFLNSKKYQGKTSGAIRLVAGPGKKQPSCASDGYCQKDERCCPTPCGRKHICMKALPEDDEE